jgi:decaprenylphospho-beta-D-erythro-pentofuranosid-2-ulose 2-reductase
MINAVGNPRSVLLLGGTSEIGQAVLRHYALASPGLRVVLAARPSPRLDEVAGGLREVGCAVETLDFDARDTASHAAVIGKAFAGGDIDLAVVAFGLLGDAEQLWQDVDAAVELATVNYTAAVSVGVALAARMRAQGHGSIVALSSVAGERVRRSNFVYGSSKAGMDGFYLGLGEALHGTGVSVTVVRPGFVKTKMTTGMDPAPLSVTAPEVAAVVADAVRNRRDLVWAPAPLRAVLSVLRHIPRPLFRRLPL